MTVYRALAAARAEFPPIKKDRSAYNYKYADLSTVMDAVTPILRKHQLEIVQTVQMDRLDTTLYWIDDDAITDDSIACSLPLPTDAASQALGSAITYARRYSIVTLLGLVTEDDDDGEAASPPPSASPRTQSRPSPASSPAKADEWIAFTEAHTEIDWVKAAHSDNGFVKQVLVKGAQYGTLTDNQLAKVKEILEKEAGE